MIVGNKYFKRIIYSGCLSSEEKFTRMLITEQIIVRSIYYNQHVYDVESTVDIVLQLQNTALAHNSWISNKLFLKIF